MGNTRKIRAGGATVLLDLERAEQSLMRGMVQLYYQGRDPRITDEVIKAAAQKVHGLNAVQTARMIELRHPSMKTIEDALELSETFCSYVDHVLTARDRTVAAHRAQKARARSGFRNDHPARR